MPELDFDRDPPARRSPDSRYSDAVGALLTPGAVEGGEIFMSTLDMRLADARERGEDPNEVIAAYRERLEAARG